jgi:hypothetical protein
VNITSQSHILYSDTVITALISYDSAILNQNWGSGLVSGSRSCRYLWEVKNYVKIEMVNFIVIGTICIPRWTDGPYFLYAND